MSTIGMKDQIQITGHDLSIEDVIQVARFGNKVQLSDQALAGIIKAYETIKHKVDNKKPVYGITTGFGQLSTVIIDEKQSSQLQRNLIMSHACGVGKPFSQEVTRAIMLLRANTLANGHSGVSLPVVETLLKMLNKGVYPVIPQKGSLGASGDLANLAHVALVMIGLGEASYNGEKMDGETAMRKAGIPLVELEGKDGLGLINGTQVMTALGSLCIYEASLLIETANVAGALTLEALQGLTNAMDYRLHRVRPHRGQQKCAEDVLRLIEGSTYVNQSGRVQDAYSLRCMPQVHGASLDAIDYVKNVIVTEMNSVTDNPIVFPEEDEIISGGNFHGQPLALALDFLAIALSELANISERRVERLVNSNLSGLPPFLARKSGINSGYMIAQYTAASLVSENKIMASPASIDSIPSSANQEDHVSMGTISARKVGEVVENLRNVLAIELMCAVQAIDMHGSGTLGTGTGKAYKAIREIIPFLDSDRVLYHDINKVADMIKKPQFIKNITGELE